MPSSKEIYKVMTPRKRLTYMLDPCRFVEEVIFNYKARKFGGKYEISHQQREMLESIALNRYSAVKAGRGIGKSTVFSWAIIWWLSVYDSSQVVATAPSFPQLQSVLWPEVNKWLKNSLVKDYFTHTAKRLYRNDDPKGIWAEPRTASKEESVQGLHHDNLLILIDEAPGVEDKIWNTLQGSLSGANNKVFLMGNPTRVTGFYFDAFHRDNGIWNCMTFDSRQSPHVDPEFIKAWTQKYVHGEIIHDLFRSHIMGEFPLGDPDAMLSLADVTEAMYREVEVGFPIELGVDVARKGDDATVICVRYGNRVGELIKLNKAPIDVTVARVLEVIDEIREETDYTDVIRIKVDDSGVGGGVTDYLDLDRTRNIEVVPCNFGGAGNAFYANEASIMWGELKDALSDISLPMDEVLKEELSSRTWELDSKGRIIIQPKKMFKKMFGASPDSADAVVLCFARKANEVKVVKSYDVVTATEFTSRELNRGPRFCSIYSDASGRTSAVFATSSGGEVRIIDEYEGGISDIIEIIKDYGSFTKIIGSSKLFDKTADDVFYHFLSSGLSIIEAYTYNELGAIRRLEQLTRDDSLKIATECSTIAQQLRRWSLKAVGQRQFKEDNGLCYALLHLVSDLANMNEFTYMSFEQKEFGSLLEMAQSMNKSFFTL